VLAKVCFASERQTLNVVETADGIRRQAGLVEHPPIEGHSLIYPIEELTEPLELEGAELAWRHALGLTVPDHG
jgi:hypothetical protein